MSKITCKLFGVPRITKDGRMVLFPYAKINALLYYILISKMVSRDEIAGLLWPDEAEKTAKKNLRNAIYQAKKSFGEDIIVSPKKSFLMLNDALEIEIDVDAFLQSPHDNLHLYEGEFLQGFFLKEAEAYEYWIVKMQNFYNKKFINESYLKIEKDIEHQRYENVEKDIRRLIDLDEYDEKNFRLLMRFYQDTGRNGKAMETYYDLSKLLRNDLGVEPDSETKALYYASLNRFHFGETSSESHRESFWYGRYKEIAELQQNFRNFQQTRTGKSVLIVGEAGIGKSTLAQKLIEEFSSDLFILSVACHPSQKNLSLRPWSRLTNRIGELLQEHSLLHPALWDEIVRQMFPNLKEMHRYRLADAPPTREMLIQVLGEAVRLLSGVKPVLFVAEDIHYMDADSIFLLEQILLELTRGEGLCLATCRTDYRQEVLAALSDLKRSDQLTELQLERLDIESCHHFLEKALPGQNIGCDSLEYIYNESKGNPLFLREYAEMIKKNMPLTEMTLPMIDCLESQLSDLSKTARLLANQIAFFQKSVPLSILQQFTTKRNADLLPGLEELESRNILEEKLDNGRICLSFTQPKLREYLYMNQTDSQKRITHAQIASLLESFLEPRNKDTHLCNQLVYHFHAAEDEVNALKYRVEALNCYFNFSHEMFPILHNTLLEQEEDIYMSKRNLDEAFEDLEKCIREARNSMPDRPELNFIEIEFFYMKGRYLIRSGEYEIGVNDIMHVIEKSKQINEPDYTLEGYKQMIIYLIQTNNSKNMFDYVQQALDLAVKCNYHKEIGILLRLKGLYYMMIGSYDIAERLLTESINTLTITPDVASRYAINIAAAHNYIGEIHQAKGQYESAFRLFQRSIRMAEKKNALGGLAIFYINLGKTAYFLNDFDTAKTYFEKTYALYDRFESFWRRSILDSYMTMVLLKEKEYEKAFEYLISAQKYVYRIRNPRDLGTVFFVKACIKKRMEKDEALRTIFGGLLTESAQYYYCQAVKSLDIYRDTYELNVLNILFPEPEIRTDGYE